LLQLKRQTQLKSLNTFNVSASATNFYEFDSVEKLRAVLPELSSLSPKLVLGGGSNLLFVGNYPGLILYPRLFGVELQSESQDHYQVAVGASEIWHDFVISSNERGWYGLENLALIPGTVGAAPVQNIGAYGVEVEQLIDKVECVDLNNGEILSLTREDCQFGYRDSLFKRAGQGRYLVTRVVFNLLKQSELCLSYAPLAAFFADKSQITAKAVIDKVCQLRREKLPDPSQLPNAGSFFKNPEVSIEQYEALKAQHPDLVAFPVDKGMKLAAGWLIDNAGYKGFRDGKVGVHQHQALVLVNFGEDDGEKILQLSRKIQQVVWQKYQVKLEPEVRIEGEGGLQAGEEFVNDSSKGNVV